MTENAIVWEGSAVFVTHATTMAKALAPYLVCVNGPTHAVVVGRAMERTRALRVAQRLDRYPAKARGFAGLAFVR